MCFHELFQEKQTLTTALARYKEDLKEVFEKTEQLDKQLSDAKQALFQKNQQIESLKKTRFSSENLENQLENNKIQIDTYKNQLHELDEERGKLEKTLVSTKGILSEKCKQLEVSWKKRQEEWSKDKKNLQNNIKNLDKKKIYYEEQIKQISPQMIKELRMQVLRYDRMYRVMRGLKENHEDRAKNYEEALGYFAHWILEKHHGLDYTCSKKLGPLLGEALEVVGRRLSPADINRIEGPKVDASS